MGKENDKLKEKVDRLSADLNQIETCVKASAHHFELLKEGSQKLEKENENTRVMKQEIVSFQINR